MDYTKLIINIQRSSIKHEDRAFVVKAVQEYVKQLEAAKAIRKPRPAKKGTKPKAKKEC